jgi:LAS superfamily LD-carboxypeptidase LdcB
MENEKPNRHIVLIIGTVVIVLAVLSAVLYAGYRYYSLWTEFEIAKRELLSAKQALGGRISALEQKIVNLEMDLGVKNTENADLSQTLVAEKDKNDLFESQIQAIGGTVGKLTKLSLTDKELLQKYSKVYFLNEHYVPENLTIIDSKYVFEKNKILQFHANAHQYLVRMLEAATTTNPIQLISAYRSFGDQTSLKNNYLVTYGSGANKFSADQGYSEHQLGTTADFTTPKLGLGFTKFDASDAYRWLVANAHTYGFILSYPKQNTYFQYEPWHWRFVGVDLATKLRNNNQFFYDLPQREIDSYLISIF